MTNVCGASLLINQRAFLFRFDPTSFQLSVLYYHQGGNNISSVCLFVCLLAAHWSHPDLSHVPFGSGCNQFRFGLYGSKVKVTAGDFVKKALLYLNTAGTEFFLPSTLLQICTIFSDLIIVTKGFSNQKIRSYIKIKKSDMEHLYARIMIYTMERLLFTYILANFSYF